MSTTSFGGVPGLTYEVVAKFDAAWWSSMPAACQALDPHAPTPLSKEQRLALAFTLATKGFPISEEIMVDWTGSPFMNMFIASGEGDAWLPNATIQAANPAEGGTRNTPPIPVGAFIVTFDPNGPFIEGYPSSPPVPAPPPLKPTNLVGRQAFGKMYYVQQGADVSALADGFSQTEGGKTYILHVGSDPIGQVNYLWQLVA